MLPQPSTDQTLRAENAELRARLEESEEMLRASRAGGVDALVVEGNASPQLFPLQGLDAEQNRFCGEVLARVSDAVIAVDTEERVTFLNAAAERQYGVRASDVLGHNLTEIYIRPWPSPEAEAGMRTSLSTCGEWRGELVHRRPDGSELPVEEVISTLRAPDGTLTGRVAAIREITERQKAEAALRRNTALFSKIIEQAPGGVYVVDAQFRVAQMNAESLPFFASAQPLIGRDFDEALEIVWGPELGPQIATIFRHTLATGERYISPRFSEQRHDLGVEQSFEWETRRITLPDGQHGVVCYFQDVTARERAEAALRREVTERTRAEAALAQNAALFAKIIEQAPGGVYVMDAQLRVREVNTEALPVFASVLPVIGRELGEVLEAIWGPELGRECTAIFRRTLETGERYVSPRFDHLRHDIGVEQVYDWETQRITLPDGQHGVVCHFQDVTARERAEEARRVSEARYRALVTASSAAAYRMSADWSEMHQLDGQGFVVDMIAPSVDWVKEYLYPEDQPQVLAVIREAIRSKGHFEMEHRVRRVDGSVGWTSTHAIPLLNAKGEIIEWFGAASDITARKQAEAAVAEANGQLESRAIQLEALVEQRTAKLTETIGELEGFAYSITHDLRAPLRAVNSFSHMLAEDYAENLDDDGKRLLDRISQSVTRMDNLIMDVLQYSRVLRMDLKLEPVNADRLVRGMLDSYPDFQEPQANIVIEGELPEVLANEAALTQCFSNLLNNAVKFVPAGAKPRVTIRAEAVDSTVRFWIEDNGIGIEPKYLETIFGLFQRLTNEYEGTGVGLSIVRKAAERMGGKAGAEAEPGQGSRFWFELHRVNNESKRA